MSRRVLVLGCGPAGLFAAHAARQLGFGVDIFSKKRRSEMFGAQYLHSAIPGLTDDQSAFEVEYRLRGELEHYLHKVYGKEIPDPGKITVESLVGTYPAWDIRRAYLRAWELYVNDISDVGGISSVIFQQLLGLGPLGGGKRWEVVVSTIPMPDLCRRRHIHTFISRHICATGDAPERGQFAPDYVGEKNVIQYDGTPDVSWYRASNIAGYNAVEWPIGMEHKLRNESRPGEGSVVTKPIRTDCNCWGDVLPSQGIRLIRVGRYGAWHRTGHTHQAYWRVLDALKGI